MPDTNQHLAMSPMVPLVLMRDKASLAAFVAAAGKAPGSAAAVRLLKMLLSRIAASFWRLSRAVLGSAKPAVASLWQALSIAALLMSP